MPREIDFEARNGRIFIDGEPFDWSLDDEAIEQANDLSDTHEFARAVHNDIMGHFLDSLSEVLGFRPSMKQVNEALDGGFISK